MVTLAERAAAVIPSAANTYSKGPSRWPDNAPRFLFSAKGCYVYDIDGRKYLDYDCALGPVILGHNHPKVNDAIRLAMKYGISFPLPTYLEVKLAELLVETIPCAEMVRFAKGGADATAAAVRLARAYTGRSKIARFEPGYHGYHDWYIGSTANPLGITRQRVKVFRYGDLSITKMRVFAAVIVEPWPTQGMDADVSFLNGLREWATKTKTILIFDEVFTGFRFPELSAQAHFGVTPDLACFSKAMANGMPISAVVGRKDIMKLLDEGVFYSTTFAGETLSIAAAIATIEELKTGAPLKRIWEHGTRLLQSFEFHRQGLTKEMEILGWPARIVLKWRDPEHGRIFNTAMIERGILFNGYANVGAQHGEVELKTADEAIDWAFGKVRESIAEGVAA